MACGGRLASHGDCWETIVLVRATVASVRLPVLVVKWSSAGSMLASSPQPLLAGGSQPGRLMAVVLSPVSHSAMIAA